MLLLEQLDRCHARRHRGHGERSVSDCRFGRWLDGASAQSLEGLSSCLVLIFDFHAARRRCRVVGSIVSSVGDAAVVDEALGAAKVGSVAVLAHQPHQQAVCAPVDALHDGASSYVSSVGR